MMVALLVAIAIGFDALSVGLALGLQGIRYLHMLKFTLLVGMFHGILPLVGVVIGHYAGATLGHYASWLAAAILIVLGIHMNVHAWKALRGNEQNPYHRLTWLALASTAFMVSVDSLSIGISLGMHQMSSAQLLEVIVVFAASASIMTLSGMLFGRKVTNSLGIYGQSFGGFVLTLLGIRMAMLL